jgi:methylase of polypeptide subunit release factors
LGISILLQNSEAFQDVFLADISPDALQVAKQNYDTLISSTQYDTRFIQSNLASFLESYEVFQQAPIILVANLPYIPDETFDTNALENVQKREPRLAFVGGDDGLDLYREMFVQIRQAVSGCSFVMFLEMMTWQVEILKAEFGEWLEFEEVKTFHFNIRIVKTSFRV